MSCVNNDDEEVAIESESCEVTSLIETSVPTLNNIWDDDKIEKVRATVVQYSKKKDSCLTVSSVYRQ